MDESQDRFCFERELLATGCRRIAGVDEAGRGPLAGPVIAAVVVFPPGMIRDGLPPGLAGLNDSKRVSPARREALFAFLEAHPEILHSVAESSPEEIDRLNILRATHLAMSRALDQLRPPPDHALVDGRPVPTLSVPQTAVVGGDGRSFSIAAASILAKVTRDRIMCRLDAQYPGYGFAQHKGYPTPAHLGALRRLGPCPVHRRSFAPVRQQQGEWFQGTD